MGSRKLLCVAVAAVACVAMSARAQFNAFEDNFDGPSLHARWGTPTNASWTGDDGNSPAGAMLLDASSAAASASVQLYRGRGFTAGPVMFSCYLKDPDLNASFTIHLDMATSCQACGWWDWRAMVNYVAGVWNTGWNQEMDETVPDLGGLYAQWGSGRTLREVLIDALAADEQCPGADTTMCDVVLIWRINVASGQLLVDDWVQSLATSTRPDSKQRAAEGWKLVTMSTEAQFPMATDYRVDIVNTSGRIVATHNAFGNVAVAPAGLRPGNYIMKVSSQFGETSSKLSVAR